MRVLQDDAKKHIKEMRDRDIINQNNGVSVHITANDAKELIDCCITEVDYNLYQISALITSNIDTIFENSVYVVSPKKKSGTERKNDQYFCIRKLTTELVKLTKRYSLLFLRLEFQDFIIPKPKKMKSKDDYITSG